MLHKVIDFSLKNKFVVLLGTLALVMGGVYAIRNIPLDAIPDLSDVQVIIYTEWPGQAPQIVQDQVTYPITTKMLSVPKAKVVRGYSFYGFSFVYVIFADGTDPYWARSRALEYLSGLSGRLPQGVSPTLGPDPPGSGWPFINSINPPTRDPANSAQCRTGISVTNSPLSRASLKSPPSAVSFANTRSPSIRPSSAPTISPSLKSPWPSNAPTARSAVAPSNSQRRNSSSAGAATSTSSTTSAKSPSA